MAANKITKEEVQETVEKVAKEASKQAKAASKAATKATERATQEAKKAVKRATTRTATTVTLQYSGKNYSTDALVKSAKDIWKYDLGRKVGDLKNIDLYVKPEENRVYYVMNDEIGSFEI